MGRHSNDHQRTGGDIGGEKIGEYLTLQGYHVVCCASTQGVAPG